ncbi:MAG: hypothetical protein J6V99_00390 [Neisseriaceae bacterium]|nr:hypothetical protein [Neisseriaceae bacterium]
MNVWQKITQLLWIVFSCTALLMTACSGNPEKQDALALGKTLVQLGYGEKLQQEFQQKLQTAKTQEEAKTILAEYLPLFEKTPQEIRSLKMKSEEGKKLQSEIADGYEKVSSIIKKMLRMNLNDQAALMEIDKENAEAQMQLKKIIDRIAELSGK